MVPTLNVFTISFKRQFFWGGFSAPKCVPKIGNNTGVGSLSLLQGIFPTQGVNTGFPQRRRILYQPSHQGSGYVNHKVVHA